MCEGDDLAFPCKTGFQGVNEIIWPGMTKREYAAIRIMAGLCANPGGPFQASGMSGWGIVNCTPEQLAASSVELADAVIKALAS